MARTATQPFAEGSCKGGTIAGKFVGRMVANPRQVDAMTWLVITD
jgi:hypothetical protein